MCRGKGLQYKYSLLKVVWKINNGLIHMRKTENNKGSDIYLFCTNLGAVWSLYNFWYTYIIFWNKINIFLLRFLDFVCLYPYAPNPKPLSNKILRFSNSFDIAHSKRYSWCKQIFCYKIFIIWDSKFNLNMNIPFDVTYYLKQWHDQNLNLWMSKPSNF